MADEPNFNHITFRNALHQLGLSDTQAGQVLGCSATQIRRMKQKPDADQARIVRPATARLLVAYLEGYRPKDWPL